MGNPEDKRPAGMKLPQLPASQWGIAAAAAIPILCLAVYVAGTSIVDTSVQLEQGYTALARALLSSVDIELQSEVRTLQGLATSQALRNSDFAAFHAQARDFAAAHGNWAAVSLIDVEGHGQILNTASPYGGEPKPLLEKASVLDAVRSGKPVIGPIIPRGGVWPTPIIVLRVPVVRDSVAVGVLSASVSPASINATIRQQGAPSDTLVTVFDRELHIVARSDGDRHVAEPASESIHRQAASRRDGLFLNVTLDGQEYRRVLVTSAVTGWSVAVGTRRETFDSALMSRSMRLAGAGALAMLFACVGVMTLGARFGKLGVSAERHVAEQLRVANAELALAQREAVERARWAERLQADLSAVMDAVPAVVQIARDAECRTIVGNRFAGEFFGVSVDSNVSLSAPASDRTVNFRVMRHGEEIPARELPLQRAARGAEVRAREGDLLFDDGSVKSLIGNASPLQGADGSAYGAVGAFLDVTERKCVEAELLAQQEKLRLFIDGTPAAIAMFDTDMRYVAASRRFAADYRVNTHGLIGRSHYEVFPEIPERWRAIHRRCLAGETLSCDEEPFPRADGRLDWVRWEIRPWFSTAGRVGGIILFSENITERKQIEEDLRAAKKNAEEANEAKTMFLATVSHDLRQPMMAQRLLLHIAASHAESLEQANILARIGEALEGAETMLSRLMDLAALELGKVPVERKVFRLDAQLAAIVAESAGEAERKGLLLRLRAPPCWSESDPMLLGRILRNLIVNAVRHTSRGWVLVAVRRRDQQYRIEIRDSGRGIPSEQQGMIFEEFRQLGNPERGRAKGQGLGLAIVARTAGLLGHRISLRSTVDRGSVFSIEVPIQAEQAGHQNCATALPPLTYPVSILLIEDDPLQAAALEGILVDAGHRVAVADRVAAAIASVSDTLDLIVTDYRLPGGASGLEAIMTIRRIAGRTIPAVLLTGDTQATIVAEAAAVGCQVLHKPCSPAAVLDAIARTAAASRAVFDAGFRDAT